MPIRSPATRTVRQRLHVEMLERAAAQTLEWPVYSQTTGALDAPTSGTWALYRQGSTSALLSAALTCPAGAAPYLALSALQTTLDLGEDYEQVLTLEYSDGSMVHRSNLAVVARRPYPTITDQDLFDEQPTLREQYATGDTTLADDIESAWWIMLRELLDAGRRPWLIREPAAFAGPHIALTLGRKYRSFTVTAPQYETLAAHYEDAYQAKMKSIRFQIDKAAEIGPEVDRDGARAPTVLCPVGRY